LTAPRASLNFNDDDYFDRVADDPEVCDEALPWAASQISARALRYALLAESTQVSLSQTRMVRMLIRLRSLALHNAAEYRHCLRVGLLAGRLAAAERTPGSPLDPAMCMVGGAGHDIGKVAVSNSVLRAENFGPEERRAVCLHCSAGFDLLASSDLEAACVAGGHHLFQANPYGVDLEAVLADRSAEQRASVWACAELVASVDFFDALTTRFDGRNDQGCVSEDLAFDTMARAKPEWKGRAAWLLEHRLRPSMVAERPATLLAS
jgi:hypothetical protein